MSLLLLFGDSEPVATDFEAEVLARDVIRLVMPDDLVIDAAYLLASNYTIAPTGTGAAISVRRILAPFNTVISTDILLHVDRPTPGQEYAVTISNLKNRTGDTVLGTENFTARRTKVDSMLSAIPNHFNSRPDSVIRNVLTAIAIQDDIIGGAKSEEA